MQIWIIDFKLPPNCKPPSVFKPLICQINLNFLNLGKLRAPDPALNSFNTTWFIPFACKKLRESKDYSTVSNSRSETGLKPDRNRIENLEPVRISSFPKEIFRFDIRFKSDLSRLLISTLVAIKKGKIYFENIYW